MASTTFRNHGTPPPLSHFAYNMAWESDGGEADESAYFSHSLLLTSLELFQGGERCRFCTGDDRTWWKTPEEVLVITADTLK